MASPRRVTPSSSSALPENSCITLRCTRERTPGDVRCDASSSQFCRAFSPSRAVSSIWGRIPASTRSSRTASPTSSVSAAQMTANSAPTPIPEAAALGSFSLPDRSFTPGSAASASPAPSRNGMETGSRYLMPRNAPTMAAARIPAFFMERPPFMLSASPMAQDPAMGNHANC